MGTPVAGRKGRYLAAAQGFSPRGRGRGRSGAPLARGTVWAYIHPMTKASDLESLAKSYLDLWQDQFAAIAADPANAEAMARLFGAMAAGQSLMANPAEGPLEGPDEHIGNDGAAGATGSASPGSSSGDRDDGLSQLAERIGALEKRIGQLERKLERAGGGARAKPKKRKS
ncbi:MAG: hypothetical protein P8Z76_14410 [Alphaproteobacteria bacterium]